MGADYAVVPSSAEGRTRILARSLRRRVPCSGVPHPSPPP